MKYSVKVHYYMRKSVDVNKKIYLFIGIFC